MSTLLTRRISFSLAAAFSHTVPRLPNCALRISATSTRGAVTSPWCISVRKWKMEIGCPPSASVTTVPRTSLLNFFRLTSLLIIRSAYLAANYPFRVLVLLINYSSIPFLHHGFFNNLKLFRPLVPPFRSSF